MDAEPLLLALGAAQGFELNELTRALQSRRLVKALLQRGTLHIVTPGDYWAISTARRELGGVLWPPSYEALVPKARLAKLAQLVLAELEAGERTFKEIRALLEPHAKGVATPTFLWRRVQGQASIVHVPPSGIWGYGGHGVYAPAAARLKGEPPPAREAFDHLVRRYLGAYGPATKQDIGQWAGVPRLKPISESLERLSLKTFADEQGRILYDLPRAPRPDRSYRRRSGSCPDSTTSSSRTRTARASSATSHRRASSRTTGSCTRRSSWTASSPARGSWSGVESCWSRSRGSMPRRSAR